MNVTNEHCSRTCRHKAQLFSLTVSSKSNAVHFVCVLKGCLIEKLLRKCVCQVTHLFVPLLPIVLRLLPSGLKKNK